MNLWIRSQDKMTLKKINDISISQNLLTNVYTIFCDHNVFGDYATKERALEVLDEIHQRLIDLQTIEYTGDYRFTKRKLDCVYEMPKE